MKRWQLALKCLRQQTSDRLGEIMPRTYRNKNHCTLLVLYLSFLEAHLRSRYEPGVLNSDIRIDTWVRIYRENMQCGLRLRHMVMETIRDSYCGTRSWHQFSGMLPSDEYSEEYASANNIDHISASLQVVV